MISIVIPSYNNPEQLGRLLGSIKPEIDSDPAIEVIVVDDCSKDIGVEKVSKEYDFVRYIRLDKNSGPAKARNTGASVAKNGVILFLDSDVVLNSDTIARIKDRFMDSSVQALCGTYDLEPSENFYFARVKALLTRSWVPRCDRETVFETAIGAIKKDLFDEMGGFDENIKTASSEEWEFGRRLIKNGHEIIFDRAITAKHRFPTFRKSIELFFHRSFMWMYVFKKHGYFDNNCTTPGQALAQITGFFAVSSFLLSFIHPSALFVAIPLLFAYMIMNGRFLAFAYHEEGAIFAFGAIPMLLVLSCAVVLGAACGFVYYGFTR